MWSSDIGEDAAPDGYLMRTLDSGSVVRVVFAALLLSVAGAAQGQLLPAPLYAVTDLGSLSFEEESMAWAINDAGVVVGYSGSQAFRWEDGVISELPALNGQVSRAFGINENGLIVGELEIEFGIYHAFKLDGETVHDLGTLGGMHSVAYGINIHGHVVGQSRATGNVTHAFFHDGTEMIDLGTLGGTFSVAYAINDSGVIVGQSQTESYDFHSFRWEDGVMTDIGEAGGDYNLAQAINNEGIIAGSGNVDGSPFHAVRWDDPGTLVDLGDLGRSPSEGYGINEDGHVVGYSDRPLRHPGLNAFIHRGDIMRDLTEMIDPTNGWKLDVAQDINNRGRIVGYGVLNDIQVRAFLAIPLPICRADFNDDGVVNTLDFIGFLNAYNIQDIKADFNGDEVVNTLDFIGFLNAYNGGC